MTQDKPSVRIGFLSSHNGTAFRVLLERNKDNPVHITPTVLITNNKSAPCLDVAAKYDVPAFVLSVSSKRT